MQRDIIFLIRGYPEEYAVQSPHFYCAKMEPNTFDLLKNNLAQQVQELKFFLERRTNEGLNWFIFRNDCEDESDAIAKAWKHLSSILDGVSLVNDTSNLPDICAVIQIRESNNPDAMVK